MISSCSVGVGTTTRSHTSSSHIAVLVLSLLLSFNRYSRVWSFERPSFPSTTDTITRGRRRRISFSPVVFHPSSLTQQPSHSTKTGGTDEPVTLFAEPSSSNEDDNDIIMTSSFPKFSDITGLHSTLLKNLQALKLTQMTEIQARTWEAASVGRDVLGRARTGTGKVRA